jgi:hypothetical protein
LSFGERTWLRRVYATGTWGAISFDALRNVADSGLSVIRLPSGNSANLRATNPTPRYDGRSRPSGFLTH